MRVEELEENLHRTAALVGAFRLTASGAFLDKFPIYTKVKLCKLIIKIIPSNIRGKMHRLPASSDKPAC